MCSMWKTQFVNERAAVVNSWEELSYAAILNPLSVLEISKILQDFWGEEKVLGI